jgi:hypothetical protein
MEGTWGGAEAALAGLLRQAALAYDASAYEAARHRLDPSSDSRYLLLFPTR